MEQNGHQEGISRLDEDIRWGQCSLCWSTLEKPFIAYSRFVLRRESIFTIIITISFEIKNLGLVYLFEVKQWAAVQDEWCGVAAKSEARGLLRTTAERTCVILRIQPKPAQRLHYFIVSSIFQKRIFIQKSTDILWELFYTACTVLLVKPNAVPIPTRSNMRRYAALCNVKGNVSFSWMGLYFIFILQLSCTFCHCMDTLHDNDEFYFIYKSILYNKHYSHSLVTLISV